MLAYTSMSPDHAWNIDLFFEMVVFSHDSQAASKEK